MAISTIGANGLTTPLPAANLGTPSAINLSNATALPKAALPTGSVLQVVQATSTTYYQTTSSTYQQTNLTTTITPTSATSKILVMVQTQIGVFERNWSDIALYRNNTTGLQGATANSGVYMGPPAGTSFDGHAPGVITYLDSPATTSATTYTMYFRSRNGSGMARVILDSMISTITAMEIAA